MHIKDPAAYRLRATAAFRLALESTPNGIYTMGSAYCWPTSPHRTMVHVFLHHTTIAGSRGTVEVPVSPHVSRRSLLHATFDGLVAQAIALDLPLAEVRLCAGQTTDRRFRMKGQLCIPLL